MRRHWKMGASGVFIIMICSSMIMACACIGNAAFDKLKCARIDEILLLSSRSVLSEYDIRLKNDYGIFAYKARPFEIEDKIKEYLRSNLGSFSPLNPDAITVYAENMEYVLTETDRFEEQIVTAGEYRLIGEPVLTNRDEAAKAEKIILNQALIKSLPSSGKNLKLINLEGIDLSESALGVAGNTYLTDKYIILTFENRFEKSKYRYSYFNYELEYILGGKMSEAENLSYVKKCLFALREPLNLGHIMSDPMKVAEIEEYIASLPPTAAPIGFAAVAAIWSAAETDNDVQLLISGKEVALNKTPAQWAVSLNAALANLMAAGGIEPPQKGGSTYQDYLLILLHLEDRETKLIRMMDLIQMNLRASYNGSLLLKEYFMGFNIRSNEGGKEYYYEHTY